MTYAKYIDENTIKLPPRKLVTPHLVAFNFDKNEALLRQEGYLPVIEDDKPDEMAQGYHLEPRYSVVEASHFEIKDILDEDGTVIGKKSVEIDDSSIRCSWVEVEDVEEAEE